MWCHHFLCKFFHKIGINFIDSLVSLSGKEKGQTGSLWELLRSDCSGGGVNHLWLVNCINVSYWINGEFNSPLHNQVPATHSAPWGLLVPNYIQPIHKNVMAMCRISQWLWHRRKKKALEIRWIFTFFIKELCDIIGTFFFIPNLYFTLIYFLKHGIWEF